MKNITIKENEYIADLNAKAIVNAEKRIGSNLLTLFLKVDNGDLPKLGDLLIIFQESLARYQHEITYDKAMDIYMDYIREGHKFGDFIVLITEIMKDAGLLGDEEEEEDSKN